LRQLLRILKRTGDAGWEMRLIIQSADVSKVYS